MCRKYQIFNITRFELKTINVRAYESKVSEIARYLVRKPWTNYKFNITQLYQVRCGVLTQDANINLRWLNTWFFFSQIYKLKLIAFLFIYLKFIQAIIYLSHSSATAVLVFLIWTTQSIFQCSIEISVNMFTWCKYNIILTSKGPRLFWRSGF